MSFLHTNLSVLNRLQMENWKTHTRWIAKRFPEYDSALRRVAILKAIKLTNLCWSKGRPDWIYSTWYFLEIDAYVCQVSRVSQHPNRRPVPMKQPKCAPLPVRNSACPYPNLMVEKPLPPEHRKLFERLKERIPFITEEHYRKGMQKAENDAKK